MKELAFLRDLAEQNSVKYGVLDRTALPVIKGSMMVLNQLSNLETTVGRFYTNLPNRMIDEAVFSLPFSDEMGDGKCLHLNFGVKPYEIRFPLHAQNHRIAGRVGRDLKTIEPNPHPSTTMAI